jgi:transcriptional regulator with XRE-family HTH domain
LAVQDIPIGHRMRLVRRSRGMTREQLGDLAGVSTTWVTEAERGIPSDRRIGPLSRISRVLGVSLTDLAGQRLPLPSGVQVHSGGMDALRRALLPGMTAPWVEGTVEPRRLANDAAETWRLRQACRYSAVGAVLPGLIVRGEQARRELTGGDRSSACGALATIYATASSLCAQVGEIELAAAAVALAARVAEEAGSPALEGFVAGRASLVLLRMGEESHAVDVAVAAAQEIESFPRSATAEEIAVHGSLLLTSAVAQARLGDAPSAWNLLAEADRDATRFGPDRTHMRTAFGLANVLLHGIGITVELGDPRAATRRAQELDPSRLPAELSERRCRYWIDVARAHASLRRPGDALDAMLRAEQVAPEEVRLDVDARDMVRELLHRQRGSVAPELRGLAERLGMSAK